MKFGSTLQFNVVPEWRHYYIDYDQLKRLIFRLERAEVPGFDAEDSSLTGDDPEIVFKNAVDAEVAKVDRFYCEQEGTAFSDTQKMRSTMDTYRNSESYRDEAIPSASLSRGVEIDDGSIAQAVASDSSDDENAVPPQRRKSTVHAELVRRKTLSFENVALRREVTRLYVLLNELLSFIDLNREGVRKALKKFDKVLGSSIQAEYMAGLGEIHVFADNTTLEIGKRVDELVSAFSDLTGETEAQAGNTLAGMLREHVVYERNTVWRDLIRLERESQGVQPTEPQPIGSTRRRAVTIFGIRVPMGPKTVRGIIITTIFVILLIAQPLANAGQSRCLAVVVFASLLWATETLPLFVTSLMIPFLVVMLRVPVGGDGEPMSAVDASAFVFAKMWSPVITVLLGGFTLAAALSKYNLAKALAQAILGRVGTNSPRRVSLVLMYVATFLCMWISNVAAPVLLFSVAQPLLRIIPTGDSYSKSLILGIALASNIGGMASPIASPQNILALQNMVPVPSWGEWFVVTLPISALSVFLIWMFLNLTFPVSREARAAMAHIRAPGGASHTSEFGFVHFYVFGVTIFTIGLWCFSHQLEPITGDMGILALVPIVMLFGTGVLSPSDFNNFLWTIVALAMGGIVLGKSVESCGLLTTVASKIEANVSGLSLFSVSLMFGFMILVVASFISHTVAALIVLPLVKSVGEQLEDPHPRLLVMLSALLCSAAMALPTSGFPNVTAVCMVDELGKPYLTAMDFISRGVPASLMVYVVVVTLGYGLCRLVGF